MQTITHFIGSARFTVAVAAAAVGVLVGLVPHAARATCGVACSDPDAVSSADLVTLVAIALGEELESACTDLSADGPVTVDDVTKAIGEIDCCECQVPTPVCGDGVKEGNEECDTGGTCIGDSKVAGQYTAGQHCTSDAACGQGNGVCVLGTKFLNGCSTDADCPDGRCIKCVPFGGDGDNCAANCTLETSFEFRLKPAPFNPTAAIKAGDSGTTVYSNYPVAPVLGLPNKGGETIVGGKDNGDHLIPFVVKAATVRLERVDLGVACLCTRAVALKTCGGTLYDKDGKATPSCTEGFNTPAVNCTALGRPPCTYVYGEGNSGAGVADCDGGLKAINTTITQTRVSAADPGVPQISFSGEGGPGSVIIVNSTASYSHNAGCSGTTAAYGPDHQLCWVKQPNGSYVDDDPPSSKGDPITVPQVTGTATGTFFNPSPATPKSPLTASVHGEPFVCLDGTIDPTNLGGVVSAGPQVRSAGLPSDSVATSQFFAQ